MWPNFIAQSFLTRNHNNNGRKSELQKLQQSKTIKNNINISPSSRFMPLYII